MQNFVVFICAIFSLNKKLNNSKIFVNLDGIQVDLNFNKNIVRILFFYWISCIMKQPSSILPAYNPD